MSTPSKKTIIFIFLAIPFQSTLLFCNKKRAAFILLFVDLITK
uniref:Uncharacterized protein n=1 Tax=Caudovirales sp. ctBpc6 TaxID=2827631 RepID=A0A8S5TMM7_9CAUD|nr:MAG TPA: hypothetical protein [Caudovirales sp. ctBpc6]DAT00291.1 MAG TPA: hypothetical protein [Caudoviricetes sp.]